MKAHTPDAVLSCPADTARTVRAALPSECHRDRAETPRAWQCSSEWCRLRSRAPSDQRDATGKCPVDGDFLLSHPAYHPDRCYHADGGQPPAQEGEHSSVKAPQSTGRTVSTGRSSIRERPSNQVINNHRRQRWTPADPDGRCFPGQSGLQRRISRTRAIRLYEFLDAD